LRATLSRTFCDFATDLFESLSKISRLHNGKRKQGENSLNDVDVKQCESSLINVKENFIENKNIGYKIIQQQLLFTDAQKTRYQLEWFF
jgi:hypothetical protein